VPVATEKTNAPRVLIVDDEEVVRAAVGDVLAGSGYQIEQAEDGERAASILQSATFDVIVSDIRMPSMSGIDLLREVRERDPDVPVILITGDPSLDTAMDAVRYGALRYLVKPFDPVSLRRVVADAVRMHRLARLRRQAAELLRHGSVQEEREELDRVFSEALQSLDTAFQPIICWSRQETFGYEALARVKHPTFPHPGVLFDAAETLGRVAELGRKIRSIVSERASAAPQGVRLFVNVHTCELLDDALFDRHQPLSQIAHRVVLEVTERAALHEIHDIRARVAELRRLGFRIAVDDLGAGYAGLNSFAELEPEVVKLDLALVRDVNLESTKRKLIGSITKLCAEMGRLVIAEGIETPEERDTLVGIECNYLQGYLFGRPAFGFDAARF